VHESTPQLVVAAVFRQAPLPSQVPSKPQGGLGVQPPFGSVAPGAIGWQEPACKATLQARQVPQLIIEQHTPSTQFLLSHSAPPWQSWPRRFNPHDPPLQTLPGAQSLSPPQTATHVVPLQANGAQLWVVTGLQLPPPSQVRARDAVVPLIGQEGAAHCVPAA
jgi:hypothetical protein